MINTRAAGDSRFARTGKDGAIYNADGVLLATVDSFTANVTYNNAAWKRERSRTKKNAGNAKKNRTKESRQEKRASCALSTV